MKLQDKIKRRFDFYKDLIRDRKEIKNLYRSFDQPTKKEFRLMLKFTIMRTLRFYSLSKREVKNCDLYSIADNSFKFKNYIFKSLRIKQNSVDGKNIIQLTQDPLAMIEEIFIVQVYEDGELKIGPEDIILDCGANIGIFSVYAAKKAKMVYAFEPSQDEIASLYENKKINKCDNIKIITKAVLDESRDAKLCLVENVSHFLVSPGITYSVLKDNIEEKMVSIKTISIDEFVKEENLERVDFIKMDIEGSEEKALLGAKKTLKEFKPKLAICLYHNLNDFYKLPLLIKRLNPDYKVRVKNKKGTLMAYAV